MGVMAAHVWPQPTWPAGSCARCARAMAMRTRGVWGAAVACPLCVFAAGEGSVHSGMYCGAHICDTYGRPAQSFTLHLRQMLPCGLLYGRAVSAGHGVCAVMPPIAARCSWFLV
jgi:hypothetical protein